MKFIPLFLVGYFVLVVRLPVARPLREALTSEKCYRAMIVRCANLNSPSRAELLLFRAIGPLGVPSCGTPNWKNRFQLPFFTGIAAATHADAANRRIARTGMSIIKHQGPSPTHRTG
jgi:hypothetical protein